MKKRISTALVLMICNLPEIKVDFKNSKRVRIKNSHPFYLCLVVNDYLGASAVFFVATGQTAPMGCVAGKLIAFVAPLEKPSAPK